VETSARFGIAVATGGGQEGMHFPVKDAGAGNLSGIIDRFSGNQTPRRTLLEEIVEIKPRHVQLAWQGLSKERPLHPIVVDHETNDLAAVIDRVTAGGHGDLGVGKSVKVLRTGRLGPEKDVTSAIRRLCPSDYVSPVVDGVRNSKRASQAGDGRWRAVFFP